MNQSFASVCKQNIGECNYYLCADQVTKCKRKNYYAKFAYKYCSKLMTKVSPKLSYEGQRWMVDAQICLEKKSEYIISQKNNSCKSIKKQAIRTHTNCYVSNGYCRLSYRDRLLVEKAVFPMLYKPLFFMESLRLLSACDKDRKE